MLIELEDKVIILDEAHNMEDAAREAASFSFTHIQISEILKEITELCTYTVRRLTAITINAQSTYYYDIWFYDI